MQIVVFEDDQIDYLYPVILARPAYAITCGAARLIDWLALLDLPTYGVVRPYLTEIQELDYAPIRNDWSPQDESWVLYLNARLIPSRSNYERIRQLLSRNEHAVVYAGETVAAVWASPADPRPTSLDYETFQQFLSSRWFAELPVADASWQVFQYAHDLIAANSAIIAENLAFRIQQGGYREIADGVFAADGVSISAPVSWNTRNGPVVLDSEVTIGPFAYMAGPVYVGKKSRLIEHASLKDAVSVGHTVKIGGEVEASIIEPYTNKQHYGFLGHSYLGSWINLGAGTCNSDLKNTYGTINMDYPFGRVATGRQFVGCIMGDYSKTAINTSIFTGKTIGVCSMLYGFVTSNVPSFVSYARLFGQVTELPVDVMIATQLRMFQRRNVVQRPCDIQLIRDMYEISRVDRRQSAEQSL
jgi:UDP-N-acetylglucosamine diphosphorylase/glucosamine-1-phosphate N-acetyltransferase